MKITTIYLEDNKIEIHNSILGKESIIVNNQIVSEKYSAFGTNHNFYILENGKEIECEIILGYSINGVVFDFYKDGKPIIVSSKIGCLSFIIAIIVISSLLTIALSVVQ